MSYTIKLRLNKVNYLIMISIEIVIEIGNETFLRKKYILCPLMYVVLMR